MTTTLETIGPPTAATIEKVLIGGDLSKLTAEERLAFYRSVCDSLGLNPLTKPFEYLTLNGKLQLYALRNATDQLRKIHGISVEIIKREMVEELYVVHARATMPPMADGTIRRDESLAAVSIGTLRGEAKANALMRAETKSKRRVTLSICGLGMLDETEAETVPGALVNDDTPIAKLAQLANVTANEELDAATVDTATGEITEEPERLPPHTYRIIGVKKLGEGTNKKGPWKLWLITTSSGLEFKTFSSSDVAACERAQNSNKPIAIYTKANGVDIESIVEQGDEPEVL